MEFFNKIGIDASYIIIVMLIGILVLLILYIVVLKKFRQYRNNYNKFMEGSSGTSLESAILDKFKEIDENEKTGKANSKNILELYDISKYCFQKFSIVKYDAFKEMGGKLSFSLCMLTDNNDGFVLTSMHSTNEGCYTYIKEIIKGEPVVLLGEEEKKVLQQAKSRKSCLDE